MEQVFRAIPTVLTGIDSNGIVDEAVIFAAWARSAGELLRERTSPMSYSENRLVIAVSDQTWKRHLEELAPQMLAKLNGSLGSTVVKFIEFRIERDVIQKRRTADQLSEEELVPPIAESLRSAANAIADEHLREQFLTAAAAYLHRQRRN